MICSSGVGFDPNVNGERLLFGFHGIWQGVAVLYDRKTRSRWLHISGECIEGRMKGAQLRPVQGRHVLWREWRADHPETLVMDEDAKFRPRYFPPASSRRGVDFFPSGFQQTIESRDDRVAPSALCYGVIIGDQAKAYPFAELALVPDGLLHDEVGGVPILLFIDRETYSATGLNRRLEGEVLEFEIVENRLRDKRTRSLFDRDGRASSGPLKGKRLKPLFGLQSEWYGWYATYPETALFERQE